MLQNPIHLRLERLESWQHVTFMACLCERMYPNYAVFCQQTGFGDGQIYRRILDLIWEIADRQRRKSKFRQPTGENLKKRFLQPTISICTAFIRQSMLAWR